VSLCEKCGDQLARPGRFCGYCLPCRECNGWHHVGTSCVVPRKESPVAADFCDLSADLQKRLDAAEAERDALIVAYGNVPSEQAVAALLGECEWFTALDAVRAVRAATEQAKVEVA
jgi:hypothetical protein